MSKTVTKDFNIFLKAALDGINPSKLIKNALKIENDYLLVSNEFLFKNKSQNFEKFKLNKNVYIAAFGKAALAMSIELENLIKPHLITGITIIPFNEAKHFKQINENLLDEIKPVLDSKLKFYYGGKQNLPDLQSVEASKQIFKMCSNLNHNDLLITLVSGGGSALLALPEDITENETSNYEFKLETIKTIVKSGANINELNTVRSCLSKVKGGKLALNSQPAKILSLIISDVIDDPLEIISSGPTCLYLSQSEETQSQKSLEILKKYDLLNKIPHTVLEYIQNKTNLSPNKSLSSNVYNYLIGNNKLATEAILNECVDYDLKKILTNSLNGEAKIVGSMFAILAYYLIQLKLNKNRDQVLNNIKTRLNNENCFIIKPENLEKYENLFLNYDEYLKPNLNRVCLVSGGETTVNLSDCNIGKGGRNQEMCLAFELVFSLLVKQEKQKNYDLLFSSFGSDGIDGPTDSAGAYYNNDTNENLQEIETYLKNHDSYSYYLKYNRLIKTGPTGTNVSDLQILLINFF